MKTGNYQIEDLPRKTLLTIEEVARFFRVSHRTIYTWCELGILASINPRGGAKRIIRESVLELLKDETK